VVASRDQPIPDARVTLVNGDPNLDMRFSWGYDNASWEDMARGRTGADGVADFPALSFNAATLLVQKPGYARYRVGWRNGRKEVTTQLTPEAVLTGEVRDAGGNPLKAFYVRLTCEGDWISTSVGPDDKGRFRFTELPAGTWSVEVRGPDGLSELYQEQVTLDAGQTKEMKIQTKK
jgi:hypothetical protein